MKPKLILGLALVLGGGLTSLNCQAAIVYTKPPEGGKLIVLKYLTPQDLKFLGVSRVDDLTIAKPCGDYVGGTNLVAGKFLSFARLASWRYLLMQGTNAVGVMELNADGKLGKLLKFVSLTKSNANNPSEEVEALRKAVQLPQVQQQDYEVRYLNMAPANFFAIWLHNATGDIIMPLPPAWGKWNVYQPYSESQIVAILKPEMEGSAALWRKVRDQEQKNFDAFERAMTAYEKAHGGKCGSVAYEGLSGPFKKVGRRTEIFKLMGKSSECGGLEYKVKVTYADEVFQTVKKVEILEKLTQ